jgi:putative chitinase
MDRKVFFEALKPDLFRGEYSQDQVDGLDALLDMLEAYEAPLGEAAYDLATAYWETGGKYGKSIENLNYTSAARLREVWPKRFPSLMSAEPYVRNPQKLAEKVYGGRADLGNTQPGDGFRYRGHGWPQLTGRGRHKVMGERLGIPLEDKPELMLDPKVSAAALIVGMREGLFTGLKLKDTLPSYVKSRAVINDDGRANGAKIAEIAQDFEGALVKAAYGEKSVPVEPTEPVLVPGEPTSVEVAVEPAAPADTVQSIRWGRVAVGAIVLLVLIWWIFF